MMRRPLRNRRFATFFGASWLAICAGRPADAGEPVADFYAGKTLTLVIGYSVGGGYDIYGRTLARYMGRHIPGNPTIVPQNMPGAGSLRAVNYLAKAAPKDGSVFGIFARGAAMEPLLDPKAMPFDPNSLKWIGSITNEVSTCTFWHTSGIKDWSDMQHKPFTVGGTGASSDTDVFSKVIRHFFHLPLKLVTGFPGGQDVVLSLQRGEVDGRCGWSWSSLISRNRALFDSKQIIGDGPKQRPQDQGGTQDDFRPSGNRASLCRTGGSSAREVAGPARCLRCDHARSGFPARGEDARTRGRPGARHRDRPVDQGNLCNAARHRSTGA
jgi:hypothetical protein